MLLHSTGLTDTHASRAPPRTPSWTMPLKRIEVEPHHEHWGLVRFAYDNERSRELERSPLFAHLREPPDEIDFSGFHDEEQFLMSFLSKASAYLAIRHATGSGPSFQLCNSIRFFPILVAYHENVFNKLCAKVVDACLDVSG